MRPIKAEEYQLDFFKREGFVRKRCSRCGAYFWTLNPEQEHCNDAPCTKYSFWRVSSRPDVKNVQLARRLFINFFVKHGHTVVKPRPVVARWREDLYLTIASIVVFQPHVTKGIAEPPANPLVIVQPCIRLEDIDNVGLTLGRHLTSFEMGGHHAFNYPDKYAYWKDETVEYAFKFFHEELGIPKELITFKESWWEGGGNAGPSFEVSVGGLELATLVFMKYEVGPEGYRETPVKTVDTGYGIERIAWFAAKTPTAFHAIYGDLVKWFHDVLSVDPLSDNVLRVLSEYAGILDPEDPRSISAVLKAVAKEVGEDVNSLRNAFEREAAVLALLDHTKTIALMLADGIVPSNAGEGYLARLVIRRALRLLRKLNVEANLAELVARQIDYWSRDYYPQLRESEDYILRMVELEQKRYQQTLSRGLKVVERIIAKKGAVSLDDLIQLYDSHGVPPDLVKEVAKAKGLHVEVPHNFYSLVAKRHASRAVRAAEETLEPKLLEWASKLPATRLLFHEDQYMSKFEAQVVDAYGRYLVLDRTAFYPLGGGQLHDEGVIRACGQTYRVVNVIKVGNVVIHVLDREFERSCRKVQGMIDWERRYRIMRHHTAVHILLGALRKLYGRHVWQAGAEKTPEKARLDVTHYEVPTHEEIRKIERLVNEVVRERRPIRTRVLKKFEAEETYGVTIYQGGAPLEPTLRIVEIEGWDVQACFGTHLSNTGEVGAVKIVKVEKIQDGVIRFEIVAGDAVAEYAALLEDKLKSVALHLGSDVSSVDVKARRFAEEYKELMELVKRYRAFTLELLQSKLEAKPLEKGVKLYVYDDVLRDNTLVTELLRRLTARPKSVALVIRQDAKGLRLEVASSSDIGVDLRQLASMMAVHGFRGGGKPTYISLAYSKKELPNRDVLIRWVMEALARLLGA